MPRPKGLPKTGGRVKGTPNKQESPIARALREAREKALQEARDSVATEQDAHSLLRMVYLDPAQPIEVRIDKLSVQESDWNCGNLITPNHKKKPFDDGDAGRSQPLSQSGSGDGLARQVELVDGRKGSDGR